MTGERRGPASAEERLAQLRRVLPFAERWEAWQTRTGEQPPDFGALVSRPLIENYADGVGDPSAWPERRLELQRLCEDVLLGSVPPPPDDLSVHLVDERQQRGCRSATVDVRFGGRGAHVGLELLIPDGDGPFPVFLTPRLHRMWGLQAVRRGYVAAVYAADDNTDHSESFVDAYPGFTWMRMARRAWAVSRCIDALASFPQADRERISATGHSRYGKVSLIAAAFDERIGAVISSSSGAGGSMATRTFSEEHFGEGLEFLTRVNAEWFLPSLRFFVGREDLLPVDFHAFAALVAPRPCLFSTALNDGVESTWAIQQTYLATRPVYELLGAAEALGLLWRPGAHETWPWLSERHLDWIDTAFGRAAHDFPVRLLHPAPPAHESDAGRPEALVTAAPRSLEAWERETAPAIEAATRWMLGTEPPAASTGAEPYCVEDAYVAMTLGRWSPQDVKRQLVFGEFVNADLYLPPGLEDSNLRAPCVVWLHPFSYSNGYVADYCRGDQIFRTLASQGYVTACFDLIGLGRRIEEAEAFYERHPHWSLLGKMVRDVHALLDAICGLGTVDRERVWLVGYGLGAMVGLHAFDERLAGAAFVAPPQPFRSDREGSRTGGLRRWARDHALLPRLGRFEGHEDDVPYDLPHLLARWAPRPVFVVAPELDRSIEVEAVTASVDDARAVYALYGTTGRLELEVPEDYHRFGPEMQSLVFEWLERQRRAGGLGALLRPGASPGAVRSGG